MTDQKQGELVERIVAWEKLGDYLRASIEAGVNDETLVKLLIGKLESVTGWQIKRPDVDVTEGLVR